MSRSRVSRSRRAPDPVPPTSYMDEVPLKLAESFRRPPRVTPPFHVDVPDLDRILREMDYDFALELSVVRSAEEQRRSRDDAARKRAEQEAEKRRVEAEKAAAAAAAASASSSPASDGSGNSNSNNNGDQPPAPTRPNSIKAAQPGSRPSPTSLPSPLLREVVAPQRILQPQTLESARAARPPNGVVVATASAAATTTTSTAFNIADWEGCEDPFEVVERKTINDLEELASVLETAKTTRESEVSSGACLAEPSTESSAKNGDAESSDVAASAVAATAATVEESCASGDAAEPVVPSAETLVVPPNSFVADASSGSGSRGASPSDDASIEEALTNVEHPPSYDEVVGGAGEIPGDCDVAVAATPATTAAIGLGLRHLQLTPSNRRQDLSSPSTPTSSGAQSVALSAVESPVDADETQVKRSLHSAGVVAPNTVGSPVGAAPAFASKPASVTPTVSFPEYVALPDFPSLSEADVPSARHDTEAAGDVFAAAVAAPSPPPPPPRSMKSNPYADLTASSKELVDKLVVMGFDVGVTSRAVQRYGVDEKQVIDHLCSVSHFSEEGYAVADAEDALLLNDGQENAAKKFIEALLQLRQFGFDDTKIKAALVAADNDTDKALDQLMVT